ncbi:hypothetical protein [Salinivibrio costicola]|uniref:Uncharacterized protein n=1 Tax=Salinivibrio costicola TaxID=51367 RepID=A0ABX6K405_SALCS|nr:hypothetical protein [Salinivibrio costicola]QIR06281.1 hypothetical protein HBA18_07765 [Salinivibrio costicola]
MTELEITYWSMIGTWFTGIATFSAVVVSLYLASSSRKTRLQLRLTQHNYGSVELSVLNRGQVYAEIERVTLAIRASVFNGFTRNEESHLDLIENAFISEETNRSLLPSSPSLTFSIELESLYFDYHFFIPYQNGVLEKPFKMPTCYVCLQLKSGESHYKEVPESFYLGYKNAVGGKYDCQMFAMCTEPDKHFMYRTSTELYEQQQDILNQYSNARKNYHMLLC